jgi:hypothetical protein
MSGNVIDFGETDKQTTFVRSCAVVNIHPNDGGGGGTVLFGRSKAEEAP